MNDQEVASDMADRAIENQSVEQGTELTNEEQENLAAFLKKMTKACENDKDVPDVVGEQLNVWLKKHDKNTESKSAQDNNSDNGDEKMGSNNLV